MQIGNDVMGDHRISLTVIWTIRGYRVFLAIEISRVYYRWARAQGQRGCASILPYNRGLGRFFTYQSVQKKSQDGNCKPMRNSTARPLTNPLFAYHLTMVGWPKLFTLNMLKYVHARSTISWTFTTVNSSRLLCIGKGDRPFFIPSFWAFLALRTSRNGLLHPLISLCHCSPSFMSLCANFNNFLAACQLKRACPLFFPFFVPF